MGEFTVSLSAEDLYRGFRLNAANRHLRPVALTALLLFAVLLLLLALSPEARFSLTYRPLTLMLEGALLLATLLLGLVLTVRNPILRSMARRTLAQRRELATPVQWSFDDEQLHIVTRFTRSDFPWDALRGWREDEHVLLVYLADQLFHAIPKAQVDAGQIDSLRGALTAHGVPRR